ncbi:DNA-directed RNA polymerase II subunit rpb4 [Nowakowskiella sp. JEL0407]|nr:DNA-directed RNA polymerase II subunit rpb4 [Nowakowskiella sp. JEL0407]
MAQRSRHVVEDTDASELKFGEEFQNIQCLLVSEVYVLLQVAKEKKVVEHGGDTTSEIMQKTIDYCSAFGKFTNKNAVKELRQLFPEGEFSQFEMAQLANLCCETAEEAKALIPSLAHKDDDDLQLLLTQMSNLRKFS